MKPQVKSTEIVYEGFFNVIQDTLLLPPKYEKEYKYFKIDSVLAVSIISETKDGKFLLCKEYRHPTTKYVYGFPGGIVDEGEDILKAAQRELLEETGYSTDLTNIKLMGSSYPQPSLSNLQLFHVFASQVEKVSEPSLEETECIEFDVVTKSDLLKIVSNTKDIDGSMLSTLFLYQNKDLIM